MSTLRRVATANVANRAEFEEYNSHVDLWTRDGFEIEHHEQSAQYVTTVFVKREKPNYVDRILAALFIVFLAAWIRLDGWNVISILLVIGFVLVTTTNIYERAYGKLPS